MASKSKKGSDSVPPPAAVEETSLAPQAQGGALVVADDDEWDFGEDAQKGFKGLTRDEFSIPFYGLLQSNSDIVKKNEVAGARGGMFINSMTKELCDKLIVQPVYVERVIVEWAPRGSEKPVVGRYKFTDPVVQRAIERNGGSIISTKEKPLYSGNDKNTLRDTRYLYFNRLADDGLTIIGFGIMGFSSTKIRSIVDATSAINQSGLKCPMWSGRFVMTAFLDRKGADDFHNIDIKAFGRDNLVFDRTNLLPKPPSNPDAEWNAKHLLYQAGKELEASIVGGQRKADFDGEHVDAGAGGESVDSPGAGRHF